MDVRFFGGPVLVCCLFMILCGLAICGQKYQEWEFGRVAVWANDQTAIVLANDHRWDLVRVIAISKDGYYIVVDGVVGNESDLKELHSLLEKPVYSKPAPVNVGWSVRLQTNSLSSPIKPINQ